MKAKKIINTIIEIITSPFSLLFRANDQPNPNKVVKPWLVLLISLAITAMIIIWIYFTNGRIFK